jgi:hypothetical protein
MGFILLRREENSAFDEAWKPDFCALFTDLVVE